MKRTECIFHPDKEIIIVEQTAKNTFEVITENNLIHVGYIFYDLSDCLTYILNNNYKLGLISK